MNERNMRTAALTARPTCAVGAMWLLLVKTLPLYQLWAVCFTVAALLVTYYITQKLCRLFDERQQWKGCTHYGRQSD